MVNKGLLLLSKLLLLFWGELTLILVLLDSNELVVTDLNFFLQKILDLDLGEVDVCLALSNDQIWVLLRIPLISDTQLSSLLCNVNKHLLEC